MKKLLLVMYGMGLVQLGLFAYADDARPEVKPLSSVVVSVENLGGPREQEGHESFKREDFICAYHSAAMQFIVTNNMQLADLELWCLSSFKKVNIAIHHDTNDVPGKLIGNVGEKGYIPATDYKAVKMLADAPTPIQFVTSNRYWIVATSTGDGNSQDGIWCWSKRKADPTFPRRAHSFDGGKSWKVETGSFAAKLECVRLPLP